MSFLENPGFCNTCLTHCNFSSKDNWLRDHYLCSNCNSLPRERAIMQVIEQYYPNWHDLVIHESSPASRGASARINSECNQYIASQYWQGQRPGTLVAGVRCENIEALTFPSDSIDLHISQDVIEHIFNPEAAFKEIIRTLRPGGAHIFTVPLVKKDRPSEKRCQVGANGEILHFHPAEYHGNPVDSKGALVTVDWGYDICTHIYNATGCATSIIYIDDINRGIRAEYIEVLVTIKKNPALKPI